VHFLGPLVALATGQHQPLQHKEEGGGWGDGYWIHTQIVGVESCPHPFLMTAHLGLFGCSFTQMVAKYHLTRHRNLDGCGGLPWAPPTHPRHVNTLVLTAFYIPTTRIILSCVIPT